MLALRRQIAEMIHDPATLWIFGRRSLAVDLRMRIFDARHDRPHRAMRHAGHCRGTNRSRGRLWSMKLQMSATSTPLSDPNSSEHQEKNNHDRRDNIERIHDRPHGFPYAKPLPIVSLGIRPKDAIAVPAHIVEAYALHGFVRNQRD